MTRARPASRRLAYLTILGGLLCAAGLLIRAWWGSEPVRTPGRADELVRRLVGCRYTYIEDGAADGSTALGEDTSCAPARELVKMGQEAVPALIENIDNTTPSMCVVQSPRCPAGTHVPVGYLCLELLIGKCMTPFFENGGGDDGFGWGIGERYYYRPDIGCEPEISAAAAHKMMKVKAAWQEAFEKGWVVARPEPAQKPTTGNAPP